MEKSMEKSLDTIRDNVLNNLFITCLRRYYNKPLFTCVPYPASLHYKCGI